MPSCGPYALGAPVEPVACSVETAAARCWVASLITEKDDQSTVASLLPCLGVPKLATAGRHSGNSQEFTASCTIRNRGEARCPRRIANRPLSPCGNAPRF